MIDFKNWLEAVVGKRGIGPGEMRTMAQSQQSGQGYTSPTMKSGAVYFDTGDDAEHTAMSYIHQGGGGDHRLGNNNKAAGRGYILNVNAPDDAVQNPDFQTDTGKQVAGKDSYRVVPQMQPAYAPTYKKVMPNPQGPMKFGGGTIARPPIVSQEKPLEPFLQRYNRFKDYLQQKGSNGI
jgi:hypothetical protein